MAARQELDAAHLDGGLIIAALVAHLARNWRLSWLSLIVSLAPRCHSGEIRPRPDPRRVGRGRWFDPAAGGRQADGTGADGNGDRGRMRRTSSRPRLRPGPASLLL